MFSAGSVAIGTGNPWHGQVTDSDAVMGTFIHYAAVKMLVTCAAFLAAGG